MGNQDCSLQKKCFVVNVLFSVALIVLFGKAAQTQDLTWAKQAGGDSTDFGTSIVVDLSGNFYVTGLFENSAPLALAKAMKSD